MQKLQGYIPDGVCLDCRQCCRFPGPDDVWRPKTFAVERDNIKDSCDSNNYICTSPCENSHNCKFLENSNNHCLIYEIRPFECSLYPFVLRKEQNELFVAAHLGCAYLQETFGTESYKNYIENLRSYFSRKDILEFLAADKNVAGDYDGYEPELVNLFVLQLP